MDGGRPDNDEAIATADELFRVALMAVGQATELVLRARTEQERRLLAQARADQAHAQAARTAERDAARAVYLAPQQESWWANATIDDVARAWTAARAWSQYDPEAIHAQEAIAKTVARRWGVDIEAVAAGGRTETGSAHASEATADMVAAADDLAAGAQLREEQDDLDAQAEGVVADVEQDGIHPGSGAAEIHPETAVRPDNQGRDVTGAAAEAGTAAVPRSSIPQQAAKARDAATPGFPLAPDAAVRMGRGRFEPKATGADVSLSRRKGRSR